MKIWIISFYFLQDKYVASERIRKFYRALSKNHSLNVFTTKYYNNVNLEKDKYNIIESKVIFENYLFRNFNSKNINQINSNNLFPKIISKIFRDSGWAWYKYLKESIYSEIKKQGLPDLIISSGSPFLQFYLCYKLKKKFKIPYFVDYRDPWTNNPESYKVNFLLKVIPKFIETKVNQNAEGIIGISKGHCEAILSSKPKLILYNLPDKVYIDTLKNITSNITVNRNEELVLSLTGTLYSYQKLDSFCEAIKNLDKCYRGKIKVKYCGSSWNYVNQVFKKYNISNNLINYKFIKKIDAIKIVKESDIALSIISCSRDFSNIAMKGEITTKIFDYISLGKIILNLSYDDYEIVELIREIGYENIININPNNTYKIEQSLIRFIKEKLKYKVIKTIGANDFNGMIEKANQGFNKLEREINHKLG